MPTHSSVTQHSQPAYQEQRPPAPPKLPTNSVSRVSVSRSIERAHGWGIAVPDDPTQVIYVWFDALTNYISALDYGTGGDLHQRWWHDSDERIHVVGKGITRFHAVYWPAFLLSAGEPIPTRIQVHPYLSANGAKISKSSGSGPAPTDLIDAFGSDALRWWVTSDVSPTSDTDFTVDRLVQRANDTLANGLGNAINRVSTIRHRASGHTDSALVSQPLPARTSLQTSVAAALAEFDRRRATELLDEAIDTVNKHIEATAPWKLLRDPTSADELADLLGAHIASLHEIAQAIQPVTSEFAVRASDALNAGPAALPTPVFIRLEAAPAS